MSPHIDHPPHPKCPACSRPMYKTPWTAAERREDPSRGSGACKKSDPWAYCRNKKCELYQLDQFKQLGDKDIRKAKAEPAPEPVKAKVKKAKAAKPKAKKAKAKTKERTGDDLKDIADAVLERPAPVEADAKPKAKKAAKPKAKKAKAKKGSAKKGSAKEGSTGQRPLCEDCGRVECVCKQEPAPVKKARARIKKALAKEGGEYTHNIMSLALTMLAQETGNQDLADKLIDEMDLGRFGIQKVG